MDQENSKIVDMGLSEEDRLVLISGIDNIISDYEEVKSSFWKYILGFENSAKYRVSKYETDQKLSKLHVLRKRFTETFK